MGTSNLYGGPKKTVLLPADYIQDGDTEGDAVPAVSTPNELDPEAEIPNEAPSEAMQPSVTWGNVRSSMKKAMNSRSSGQIKGAIRNYTKALGGHSNATRQAAKARRATGALLAYFSGTPESIRQRFEDAGIRFDGRATKEIIQDICLLIAPTPNDIEDSLVNKALLETFSDIAIDQSIDMNQLDSFNEDLLQRLVGGMVKHYIFDKLIVQSEQTALKRCESVSALRELEKSIKLYIDGIVDSIVPEIVKSGMNAKDFNRVVETLYDITYQQMEEMQ